MNFEFKSTFKKIITPRGYRIDGYTCSACILFINVASLFLLTGLYLENIIIPATYGSGPSATLWILAFKASATGWMISTLFAALHLVYIRVHRKPLFIFLKDRVAGLLTVVKGTVRVQLIQCLLVIHLLKDLERYGQHRFTSKHLLSPGSIHLSSNISLIN